MPKVISTCEPGSPGFFFTISSQFLKTIHSAKTFWKQNRISVFSRIFPVDNSATKSEIFLFFFEKFNRLFREPLQIICGLEFAGIDK